MQVLLGDGRAGVVGVETDVQTEVLETETDLTRTWTWCCEETDLQVLHELADGKDGNGRAV